MFETQFLVDIATSALAILVAVLAIYLAFRLLGKVAKFVVTAVVIVVVAWFLFSNNGALGDIISEVKSALPLLQ